MRYDQSASKYFISSNRSPIHFSSWADVSQKQINAQSEQ